MPHFKYIQMRLSDPRQIDQMNMFHFSNSQYECRMQEGEGSSRRTSRAARQGAISPQTAASIGETAGGRDSPDFPPMRLMDFSGLQNAQDKFTILLSPRWR
jgi:hypothetical protein